MMELHCVMLVDCIPKRNLFHHVDYYLYQNSSEVHSFKPYYHSSTVADVKHILQ